MSEPYFAYSPSTTNADDQFFSEFIETACVDASQFIAPTPLKISPPKGAPATLLSPQASNLHEDSFLYLLDGNFEPSAFLTTPTSAIQHAPQHDYSLPAATISAATTTPFVAPFAASATPEKHSNLNKKKNKKKKNTAKGDGKKSVEQEAVPLVNRERTFNTVYAHPLLCKSPGAADVVIKVKTRRDQPSEAIPERLFNSIKYSLVQTASGFPEDLQFILARVRAVDAESLAHVKKNGKDVLKGTVEAALTKPPRNHCAQFEGQLYVQFTDVSYHVEKREYCLEVSYFSPNDLENPILIKRSAPFKSFARKPNKKRGKKKRDEGEEEGEEEDDDSSAEEKSDQETAVKQQPPKKKKKKCSSNFELFVAKADELLEFNKKLGEDERKQAMALVLQKFYQIDPTFTATAFFPAAPNSFSFPPTALPFSNIKKQ